MYNLKKNFTKAESLVFLKKFEKKLNIKVPKLIFFTKKQYIDNKELIFTKIKKNSKKKKYTI